MEVDDVYDMFDKLDKLSISFIIFGDFNIKQEVFNNYKTTKIINKVKIIESKSIEKIIELEDYYDKESTSIINKFLTRNNIKMQYPPNSNIEI